MYCPKCGSQNPDAAARCVNCQEPLPQVSDGPTPPPPPNPDPYSGQPAPQQPYVQPNYQGIPPKPPTFLVGNIIMTVLGLCTCFPLITGIIGIIFSAMVTSKYNAGDYEGSRKANTVAKVLFFVTLGLVVCSLIWVIASLAYSLTYLGEYSGIYQEIFDQIYDMY